MTDRGVDVAANVNDCHRCCRVGSAISAGTMVQRREAVWSSSCIDSGLIQVIQHSCLIAELCFQPKKSRNQKHIRTHARTRTPKDKTQQPNGYEKVKGKNGKKKEENVFKIVMGEMVL